MMLRRASLRGGPFLLGLVCLLPLLWAPVGALIYTSDYNLPLDPRRNIGSLVAGWSTDNLGTATDRFTPHLFPFLAFWRVGQAVGIPLWLVQKLWLVGLFVLAFVSAKALVHLLVPRARPTVLAVVALTYVFNPFTLYSFAVGHNIAFLAYAAAPLWLTMVLRAVRGEGGSSRRIVAAATSLLFASSFDNPAIIVALVIGPTALFLVAEMLDRRFDLRAICVNTAAVAAWAVGFHAWWLIPNAWNALGSSPYRYAGSAIRLFDWPGLSTRVPFIEFLRGEGFWGQYAQHRGEPYFSWAASFTRPFLVVSCWLLASLAVAGLLVSRRPPAWVKLGSLLFVMSVGLSKGINPPLSEANRWLYLNVPGFYVFRGTYEKFAGMTFLAVLLGAAAVLLIPRWPSRVRLSLAGVLMLLTAASAWPLVTGDVAPSANANGVSSVIRIPPDYERLRDWTRSTVQAGSLLVVPQSPGGYVKTEWGYAGVDPLTNFSAVPVITGEPEARASDGRRFAMLLQLLDSPENAALAQRMGVAYVVVRHDIDPFYYAGTMSPAEVEGRLRQAGYRPEISFGKLSVLRPPLPSTPLSFRAAGGAKTASSVPPPLLDPGGRDAELPAKVQLSGTGIFRARMEVPGSVWVYLPQDFSREWHLAVDTAGDTPAMVVRHARPPDFGNAWLVRGDGPVSFRVSHGKSPTRRAWLVTAMALFAALFCIVRDRTWKSRAITKLGAKGLMNSLNG